MEEDFQIRDLEPGDESTLRMLAAGFTADQNSRAVEHWSADLSTVLRTEHPLLWGAWKGTSKS